MRSRLAEGGAIASAAVRAPLLEAFRYGLSGGAAVVVHLAVLMILVEAFACPKTLASAIGFACATPVNYLLQHRFVFHSTSLHRVAFPRYMGITLAILALNTGMFWFLTNVLGAFYIASQVLTIAVLVPTNFALHRVFTFARA